MHLLRVPFHRSAREASGDRSEQHRLGQRRGIFESRGRLAVSQNRLDEVEIVVCRLLRGQCEAARRREGVRSASHSTVTPPTVPNHSRASSTPVHGSGLIRPCAGAVTCAKMRPMRPVDSRHPAALASKNPSNSQPDQANWTPATCASASAPRGMHIPCRFNSLTIASV